MKTPPIPKDQKKYPKWVGITIPVTKAELHFYAGSKCREYEPDCGCCKAWRMWERTGKIKTIVERRANVMNIEEELK